MKYDQAGRKIETADVDAAGAVLRTRAFGYDAAGNLTSQTTATGHTTTRAYDAANRLVEQHEPVSATETITTSFGYDAAGQQTRATDGRGNSTYTTYNSLGLVESVIEPSTAAHPDLSDRTWTNIYDAAGNQVTSLLPGGVKVERTFDELNRLVKQIGSGAEAATEDKNFGYDLAGRLTRADELAFSLNDRGLLLKSSGPGGDISAYAYDADNRLVQRADSTGTASFSWDDADRLTSMTDPVTSSTIEYGYDKAARLTSMAYGANGARRSFSYDALNRLTKDELKSGQDSPIASIDYGYDVDDNMTTKTTTGTAGAGTNTYTYDWANRLTSWTATDGKTTEYGWDAAGNRIRAGDKTYTYDERNRLTSGDGYTYTYTARGTLAESSNGKVEITKFDAFDRLIQDDAVTYDYDALDRMAGRTEGGQTMKFAYDGQTNNLVAVTDGGGVKKAAYGRDAFGRTVSLSDAGSGQLAFSDLHGDLIGTFTADGTALTDSTAYNPFGEVIARTGTMHSLGYQGGYTDPSTKKVNMAARWYQPTTGSFVSRDTVTLAPDPSLQLNRYTYANDNPLTNTDPDGHKAKTATVSGSLQVKKTKTKKIEVTKAEYASCKNNDFKGKSCKDEEKLFKEQKAFVADCVEGYVGSDDSGACKAAGKAYLDCRFGSKDKLGCEVVGINAACKYLKGGTWCDNANPVYESCKRAYPKHRVVCIEGNQEYLLCRRIYDKNRDGDVCAGAVSAYERCRPQGSQPGCEAVREIWAQCRYSGYSKEGRAGYGQSVSTCNGVGWGVMQCGYRGGSPESCFSVALVQLNCLAETRNLKGCANLAGDFYACVYDPNQQACSAKPVHKCTVVSGRTGGKFCNDTYSSVQAWLKAKLQDKWEGDVSKPCEFLSIASVVAPAAAPHLETAATVCGVVGAVANKMIEWRTDQVNDDWEKARKNHPGNPIKVSYNEWPRWCCRIEALPGP
ncbi:hypothetical protein B1L11_31325 [Microbispora sp. GKU 823]|nr:hypothetical protein B1L11_31325 [Microbispora sp. GKU 823]